MLDDVDAMLADVTAVWGDRGVFALASGAQSWTDIPFLEKLPDELTTVRGAMFKSETAIFEIVIATAMHPKPEKDDKITFKGDWVVKRCIVPDDNRRVWRVECYPAD